MKISDQVVLVTGSSRGLGKAIASAFNSEGARLVVNGTDKDRVEAVAKEFNALPYTADITQPDQVRALFHAAEQHFKQPITTVVNNALRYTFNGDGRSTLGQITWDEFHAQISGAVRGALNTTQAALPGFGQLRSGRIINIGSNLFQSPVVPYHDYVASKGALLAFTRTAAVDLGGQGVTCNMVTGGLLSVTDASAATPKAVFDQIEAVTPLRKVTTPEDVAGAVLFFASPWCEFPIKIAAVCSEYTSKIQGSS